MPIRKTYKMPRGVHTNGVRSMVFGIELALRYARGDAMDVVTLRRDYKISRATAYRYKRLLEDMGGGNFVVARE